MQIQEYVPLSPLTTFHIGGPARFFASVHTTDELREAFIFAQEKKLKVFVLGGGSNILVDDTGFDGLVIKIEIRGVEEKENIFIVGAGELWDELVVRAIKENLWGIENLSGIPGTVGGAVVQNIGAYGAALSQTLQWVEVFDTTNGEIRRLSKEECGFEYRDSIFKHDNGRHIVLRAAFLLLKTPAPNVSYKDLAQKFGNSAPSLGHMREEVIMIRKNKFPDLSVEGTAGSFFKNPVLPEVQARQLQRRYPKMPLFGLPESPGMKIPLAWLLDRVLGMRGLRVGSARLFENQPLVIVAQKKGSSEDVKKLARMVVATIREKIGITIEPEVRIM
jgi:UDP-N-acetylmuramate dehydrogenase